MIDIFFKIGMSLLYIFPGIFFCWAVSFWPKKTSWLEAIIIGISVSVITQSAVAFAVNAVSGFIDREKLIFAAFLCNYIVILIGSIIKIKK